MRLAIAAERNDIADSRKPWQSGTEERIDGDVAAIQTDSKTVDAKAGCDRAASRRDQQIVGVDLLRSAIGQLRLYVTAGGRRRRLGDFRTYVDSDSLFSKRFLQLRRYRFIFDRD